MFPLMSYVFLTKQSSCILPSSLLRRFKRNHKSSSEKFQRAEGGCRVGLTSILTSNSCPVNGWRLGSGGKRHSSLTRKEQKETLYAASDTCTRLVGPRGNSISCRLPPVSPEQTELPERTGREKHTSVCYRLGLSLFLRHAH